jgi:hypothetical protein
MLPEEFLIDDERVIALRAVPDVDPLPEVVPAAFLPTQPLRLEMAIVDADGDVAPSRLDPLWLVCPVRSGVPVLGCLDVVTPLALDSVPACPSAAPSANPAAWPDMCVLSDELSPSFAMPTFAQAFEGGALGVIGVLGLEGQDDEPGQTAEACADALLSGAFDTPNRCRFTSTQLSVDASAAPPVSGGPPVSDPNTHPRITGIAAERLDADGEVTESFEIASGDRVSVEADQSLRLSLSFPEEDRQSYVVPSIEDGEVVYDEVEERLEGRWFTTAGVMDFVEAGPGSLSDPRLSYLWLPEEGETGVATVWAVLLDGRSGLDWIRFEVESTG